MRTPTTTSLPSPVAHVLGPILFLLYVADSLKLTERHRLSPHANADDTEIYGFCQPSDVRVVAGQDADVTRLTECPPASMKYRLGCGPTGSR